MWIVSICLNFNLVLKPHCREQLVAWLSG